VAFLFTVERDGVRYIFDIETDGLLEQVTKIHCLVLRDIDTGRVQIFKQHDEPVAQNVADGLRVLMGAE
jgi:hypothetical protein